MTTSIKSFLETFYWIVGVYCSYFMTTVLLAMVRYKPVELSFLAECTEMEAVIYALTMMWVPLGALHFFLFRYQGLCRAERAEKPHFPGSISDHTIPRELKELRWVLFVFLVAWPTVVYGYCAARTFDSYHIVTNHQLNAEDPKTGVLKKAGLVTYLWQWPEGRKCGEYCWWVNTRTERDDKGARVKVSAVGLQPVGFVVMTLGLAFSLLLAIYRACTQLPLPVSGAGPNAVGEEESSGPGQTPGGEGNPMTVVAPATGAAVAGGSWFPWAGMAVLLAILLRRR